MRGCEVNANAWTMPAPNTPGHDAMTRTLIGARTRQAGTFNARTAELIRTNPARVEQLCAEQEQAAVANADGSAR